jgi:restriction endonuclease S subunit
MKLVKLSEYFEIEYPKTLILDRQIIDCNGVNFVSSTGENNGVSTKVQYNQNNKLYKSGSITVPLKGTVLSAFLQNTNFYCAHQIAVLTPKSFITLTDEEKLFYCTVIQKNKYKYSYGRQADKTLAEIKIPVKESIPAFVYKQKIRTVLNTPLNDCKIKLNVKSWKVFKISELFEVEGTKTTPLRILEENGVGKYPYITTKATNNACDGFYNIKTENGNVITVDSAVVGYASYQEKDFSASDHVEKLISKFDLNLFIAMFITTLINQEQYRFHYGRKASQNRLKSLQIKLPSTLQGEPDWQFMENYIKSLPYSNSL